MAGPQPPARQLPHEEDEEEEEEDKLEDLPQPTAADTRQEDIEVAVMPCTVTPTLYQ